MINCPKCGHSFEQRASSWRDYLKKRPGYKVHFFSNKGNGAEPHVTRTRLYFEKLDIIEAALRLVSIEHKHDPFFRWCDCADGKLETVIINLKRGAPIGK